MGTVIALAVTGHRPQRLGGFSQEVNDRLFTLACNCLSEIEPRRVLTGMALGWDMAIAEAASLTGTTFHAYVPFEGQEAMWPDESKRLYHNLLSRAKQVIICSPGGYSAEKMHIRNRRMINSATGLLALWDGGGAGGTASAVRYAKQQNVQIINVWDRWEKGNG